MSNKKYNLNGAFVNYGYQEDPSSKANPSTISIRSPSFSTRQIEDKKETVEKITLKPRIGIITSISFIVGTIIGSGIFISPTGVFVNSGSAGLSLVVWAISGVIAIIGALCYLELALLIPKSGAEYSYLLEAYGPLHPKIGPLIAFLIVWSEVIVLRPASNAVKVLTFIEYFMRAFFPTCSPSFISQRLLAVPIICLFSYVNGISVKMTSGLQNILTGIKLLGLAVIFFAGFVQLGQGKTKYLENSFYNAEFNGFKIAKAFYNALWAYSGWNALSAVTEEMIKPHRDIPRAIWSSMILVIIIYLGVNVAYFTVISPSEMKASDAVAVTFCEHVLGLFSYAIPFIVAASVLGSFNGSVFTIARISAVAARDGYFPNILSCIHVDKRTPIISIIVNTAISLIMLSISTISELINFSSFIMWMFSCFTMFAIILLRRRKHLSRHYSTPLLFPIIMILVSLYLVIAPIIDKRELKYLYAVIIIVVGIIVYVTFIIFNVKIKFLEKFEKNLQILFKCLPMQYEDSKQNLETKLSSLS